MTLLVGAFTIGLILSLLALTAVVDSPNPAHSSRSPGTT